MFKAKPTLEHVVHPLKRKMPPCVPYSCNPYGESPLQL